MPEEGREVDPPPLLVPPLLSLPEDVPIVPDPEFLFEGAEIPPEFLGEVELPEPLFIPVKPLLPLDDEPTELLPLALFDIPP